MYFLHLIQVKNSGKKERGDTGSFHTALQVGLIVALSETSRCA